MPNLAVVLLVAGAVLVLLIVLDLARRVPLINPVVVGICVPLVLNAPLLGRLGYRELGPDGLWILAVFGLLLLWFWIRLTVAPVRDGVPTGLRLKALGGAAPILWALCWATIVEAVVLPLSFVLEESVVPLWLLVTNTGFALGCCLLLYLDGALRAILLSRSLSPAGKVFLLATLWIPVIGWVAGVGVGRTVRKEYLAAVDRVQWESTMPEDQRCATRFPIILVHGVGWRDYRLFNAWGRIPTYLKRHGATIFHGEQQGWGSIEANGTQVAARIDQVLEETGAGKVNLIAHSRGGIDSRYAISALGIGDKVASLTTMNSPHHGVRFADTATKLKEPLYRRLAAAVDYTFGVAGDESPDFFASTMAFRTRTAREFNRAHPDDPRVYYQSYTSVMSSPAGDRLLGPSYRVIKALGEENDGLVSVDSAKWGEFRGVIRSSTRRGVSHGDLVDMHREDFAGFNVLDAYIGIVADLKQRGF